VLILADKFSPSFLTLLRALPYLTAVLWCSCHYQYNSQEMRQARGLCRCTQYQAWIHITLKMLCCWMLVRRRRFRIDN